MRASLCLLHSPTPACLHRNSFRYPPNYVVLLSLKPTLSHPVHVFHVAWHHGRAGVILRPPLPPRLQPTRLSAPPPSRPPSRRL